MGVREPLYDNCLHEQVVEDMECVRRDDGEVSFAFVDECVACGATWYEPSSLDKFPDTGGLDPRLYKLW